MTERRGDRMKKYSLSFTPSPLHQLPSFQIQQQLQQAGEQVDEGDVNSHRMSDSGFPGVFALAQVEKLEQEKA